MPQALPKQRHVRLPHNTVTAAQLDRKAKKKYSDRFTYHPHHITTRSKKNSIYAVGTRMIIRQQGSELSRKETACLYMLWRNPRRLRESLDGGPE
jgi:hypothetical protein